ncbi:hypothetical protein BC629DRAFT_1151798 [Irpex lacteus]|nr:hypothetical protein BC629DRAFT_1151798 [Irpex lacteus]
MASSILRRVWNRLRSPRSCVGKDLEGNKYFEYPNPNDNFGRTKRVVKYRHGYDMWTYIAGKRRLPVQWTAWLTHTRVHAPTIEERLRLRVAMLEAADRAMPITSESINVDSTSLPDMHNSTFAATIPGPAQMTSGRPDPSASRTDHKAMPEPAFPSPGAQLNDEPEAWTPQVSQRRSK